MNDHAPDATSQPNAAAKPPRDVEDTPDALEGHALAGTAEPASESSDSPPQEQLADKSLIRARPVRRVGLLLDASIAYYRDILAGIASYARQRGHWIIHIERTQMGVPLLDINRWQGEGLIANALSPTLQQSLQGLAVPVVNVSNRRPDPRVPMVTTDNHAIGRVAAEHLMGCGFKYFAFAGFPGFAYSDQRGAGYCQTIEAANCECHVFSAANRLTTQWTYESDYSELLAWMRKLPRPIALLGCNDVRARHLSEAASILGWKVPEEAAILGVDNDELVCEFADPPLSSVQIAGERVGYEAAALLDRLMDGEPAPAEPIRLAPGQVQVRRSTDVLAIDSEEVRRAVQFIRAHVGEKIDVGDVLHAVPMARRALERRFHQCLGRTPFDEIQRVRLQLAQSLLANTDLAMPDVADKAGYLDGKHLSQSFHKNTGMTPTKYRRQFRNR